MITPPRMFEALLQAFGAEPSYRDAVVGDLAEEFATRAERDGDAAARRWYRREAFRAVPHLLRSGWHLARARGLGHLLGILLTAYTGTMIVGWILAGASFGTLRALGLLHVPLRLNAGNPLWQASMVVLGMMSATFTGYLAAWLNREAPLFTALALGLVWSSIEAVGLSITRGVLPMWYVVAIPIVIVVGCTCGGMLRVGQVARAGADDVIAA